MEQAMSASNVFQFIDENNVKFVDLRLTDMRGIWHHMTLPISFVTEEILSDGIYFDGSSIVHWRDVHESDMLMRPDTNRLTLDPFSAQSTLVLFCTVYDPKTDKPYTRDTRAIGL